MRPGHLSHRDRDVSLSPWKALTNQVPVAQLDRARGSEPRSRVQVPLGTRRGSLWLGVAACKADQFEGFKSLPRF